MNQGCVTLDEVFAAAAGRAASIVPETSGYLALALGDATSRASFAIEERSVLLTTEGSVTIGRRGAMQSPQQAAEGLRSILARLLSFATGSAMPALSNAARAREESDRGVDAVVHEIEAALIPVNRAAARRALARLARETIKAKENGRLRPVPPAPPRGAPVAAASPGAPAPVVAQAVGMQAVVVQAVAPTMPTMPTPLAPPPAATALVAGAPVLPPAPPSPTPAPSPVVASLVEAPPESPVARVCATPALAEPSSLRGVGCVSAEGAVVAASGDLDAREDDSADESCPEPTPTVLGMSLIDIDPDQQTTIEPEIEESSALDAGPSPTGLVAVLSQPKEDPALAFGHEEAPRALPPTQTRAAPSEPREAASDLAPTAAAAAPPSNRAVVAAPPPPAEPLPLVPSRADDLLASFTVSGADEAQMRATLASLRRIAGLDESGHTARPPSVSVAAMASGYPVRVELRLPPLASPASSPAASARPPASQELRGDDETPSPKRATARTPKPDAARGGTLLRFGVAGFVLGLLFVAGATVVRLRPDLVAAVLESRILAPTAPRPMEAAPTPPGAELAPSAPAAPSPPPPPTVERLGGTRAERGSSQRPR
jgi:hypothetical protein